MVIALLTVSLAIILLQDAENKIAESIAKAKEDFADELQRAKTQQELVTADLERQLIEKRKDVASATQEVRPIPNVSTTCTQQLAIRHS